jgi:mannose-6-phosphate isomerase-like protein (cupin superfamily)/heme-degrading monooxygenase HmoA
MKIAMRRLLILLLMVWGVSATAQAIKDRVIPNDPSRYKELSAVHAGAGKMGFTQLIGRTELATNFLYLHAGIIESKSGIGHHFHHTIEEMYVILDGEAEFTINGNTSKIKAPAVVPCKKGDSHAIYNPTGARLRWLNFAVSSYKGRGDAFDLGDPRVGVKSDPIPLFVSARLERDKLKTGGPVYTNGGVLHRRLLGPEVFQTDWNHVDHVVIPAGASVPRKMEAFEEVFYVIKGAGTVSIKEDKAGIKSDDAFFGGLGETLLIANSGNEDLELLVIGVAPAKQKGLTLAMPLTKPKAMALQMDFVVPKENADAFEKMYYSIYVPAMTVQPGYLGSKLLRLFPENISKEIQAEPTVYNYQIQISFDTEENRRKWVASSQHQIAWPAASSLATEFKWRGYDVMGDDEQE